MAYNKSRNILQWYHFILICVPTSLMIVAFVEVVICFEFAT